MLCTTSGFTSSFKFGFFALIFLVVYVGAILVSFVLSVMMSNTELTETNESVLRSMWTQ